jgi:TetR/AcrR family transcriptional regulator, repressor of fatR-cypB operon
MPKLKDEQKLAAIQSAALKLVIRTGFSGLKIADVAKEAGIGTGTLYVYYGDKEQLIEDIYLITKKEIAAVLFDPAHVSDTFRETFKRMWLAYFGFCLQQPEKMLFVEQFLYSGFISESLIAETEAMFVPLDNFLIQAQEQGLIKNVSVEIAKAFIQGAIHEVVKVITKKEYRLIQGELEKCFEMAWGSIKI